VLVALAEDDARFEDEDVQLLELLTAHAGAAIDGIYTGQDPRAGNDDQNRLASPE
jgi:GAF domain-containing protein